MKQTAAEIARRGAAPQYVVHSPTERTSQTARIVAETLRLPLTEVAELGADEPAEWLIHSMSDDRRERVVVTHLPLLQRVAARLLPGRDDGLTFPPGAVAALVCEEGEWSVSWYFVPEGELNETPANER